MSSSCDSMTCPYVCLSDLTGPNPALPDDCHYFQASCDESLQFCLLQCRGPCVPYSVMTRFSPESRSLTPVNILEQNSRLRDVVADVVLPTLESFTVPASEGLLWVWLEGEAGSGGMFFYFSHLPFCKFIGPFYLFFRR